MSIDFATLQGLTIPEGVVKKITDASGQVLWEGVKKVIITVTGKNSSGAYVQYNGTKYQAGSSFEAVVGESLFLSCILGPGNFIRLNGSQVATSSGEVTYQYTVVSNATIEIQQFGSGASLKGYMYITDELAPDATIAITGNSYSSADVTINGITYNSPTTLVVPAGTVITCKTTNGYTDGRYTPDITWNGTVVAGGAVATATYNYTTKGNATIALSRNTYYNDDDDKYYVGKIAITDA